MPFGGRSDEFESLDRWLSNDSTPPRLVLTGPGGRGKSALIVQWIGRLKQRECIGIGSGAWQLVFVPVSMRVGTDHPNLYCEAIAARLGEILQQDIETPPAQSDPTSYYENKCRLLLDEAVTRKMRVLLVIDGIDEAFGGRFNAGWFPRAPGSSVRILVSARLQVGDRNSYGWVERLSWDSDVRVETHDLAVLSFHGVRDLLRRTGAPVEILASRPDIVERLSLLSGGEPLLLRLYVEDLWRRGSEADRLRPEDLDSITPGFEGYFRDWLRRQREAWQSERGEQGGQLNEPLLSVYLGILACAYAPMSAEELGAVARRVIKIPQYFRAEDALHPLRRFIMGADKRAGHRDGGYVLSHPKFGDFLREDYLDQDNVEQIQEAFAMWGRTDLRHLERRRLSPEKISPYLLRNLAQHLEDAGASAEDFMGLTEEGWLRAWEASELGYRGFVQDVQRVRQVVQRLADEGQPRRAWELRCQLLLNSLANVGARVSGEMLSAAVKSQLVPPRQALHWLEYQTGAAWTHALVTLAPQLPEALFGEMLEATHSIRSDSARVRILADLVPFLPDGLLHSTMESVWSIKDDGPRALLMAALMPRLTSAEQVDLLPRITTITAGMRNVDPRTEILSILVSNLRDGLSHQAIKIIWSIETDWARAETLAAFIPRLPKAMLGEAMTMVRSFKKGQVRARVLVALLPHLPDDLLDEALAFAREIWDYQARAQILAALASRLPDADKMSVLGEALVAARAIGSHGVRAETLVALARKLPNSQRADVLADVFIAVQAILNYESRARVLAGLVKHLPEMMFDHALLAVRRVTRHRARAQLLMVLYKHSPESRVGDTLVAEALEAVRAVKVDTERALALAALSVELPDAMLGDALTIAINIGDMADRNRGLAALAPRLPKPLLIDALANAWAIGDYAERAQALCSLALYLPKPEKLDLLGELLAIVHEVENDELRAKILIVLGLHLPEGLLSRALTMIRAIRREDERVRVLVALASILPEADLNEALTIARSLKDDSARAEIVVALADHLPASLFEQALSIARSIQNALTRTFALSALAPRMPDQLLDEALAITWLNGANMRSSEPTMSSSMEAVRKLQDEFERGQVLTALVPMLPEAMLDEALEIALHFAKEPVRIQVLKALSDLVPLSLFEKMLKAVDLISRDDERSAILTKLAPRAPKEFLKETIRIICKTRFFPELSDVLPALAPRLPEELLRKLLAYIREIDDPIRRVSVLVAITPHLPETLKSDALDHVVLVGDKISRPLLLASLPAFYPIVARFDGLAGLREIRRAIHETAKWFP